MATPRRELQLASLARERNEAVERLAAFEARVSSREAAQLEAEATIDRLTRSEAALAAEAEAAHAAAAHWRTVSAERSSGSESGGGSPQRVGPQRRSPAGASTPSERELLRAQLAAKARETDELQRALRALGEVARASPRVTSPRASPSGGSASPYASPGGGATAPLRAEIAQLRAELNQVRALTSGGREAMGVEREALLTQSATLAETLGESEANAARVEQANAVLESNSVELRRRVAALEREWQVRNSEAPTPVEQSSFALARETHASALRVIQVRARLVPSFSARLSPPRSPFHRQ